MIPLEDLEVSGENEILYPLINQSYYNNAM